MISYGPDCLFRHFSFKTMAGVQSAFTQENRDKAHFFYFHLFSTACIHLLKVYWSWAMLLLLLNCSISSNETKTTVTSALFTGHHPICSLNSSTGQRKNPNWSASSQRPFHFYRVQKLTCTLGPAHERRPRRPGAPLSRPGQQHTDVVLCVWIQVPQLIGDHVDSVHLRPRGLAGTILNLFPDDGAVSQDGVGVKLDDQVSGAGAQQLRWGDGGWRNWKRK